MIIEHIQKAKLFHNLVDTDKKSHCLNVRFKKLSTQVGVIVSKYLQKSVMLCSCVLATASLERKHSLKMCSESGYGKQILFTIYLVAP